MDMFSSREGHLPMLLLMKIQLSRVPNNTLLNNAGAERSKILEVGIWMVAPAIQVPESPSFADIKPL
jgi:hypothetical protein